MGLLADRYAVSVAALAEANDIVDVDLIVAGRILEIPGVGPKPSSSPDTQVAATAASPSANPAILKQIETLYRAARFDEALAASRGGAIASAEGPASRARLELLRGKIETAFGNVDKARAHFRAALEIDPDLRLSGEASPKIAALFEAAHPAHAR